MKYIDIILALPLVWGAIMGFKKGLILELASLVALFLGIYGALKFSGVTANFLKEDFGFQSEWIGLISFILTFVLIVITIYLLAKLLDKTLKIVALGLVNRLLGLFFGLVKYSLIVGCLLFFFDNLNSRFQLTKTDLKASSYLYEPIQMSLLPFKSLLSEVSFNQYDSLIEDINPESP